VGSAKSARDSAVSERDRVASQLRSVEQQIQTLEGQARKFINDKATIDAKLPSLRATRDNLKAKLAQMQAQHK